MLVVKDVNENYPKRRDMEQLLGYIVRPDKCRSGYIGAQGINITDSRDMMHQMMIIKQGFAQTRGKMMKQYIVSFAEKHMEVISPDIAMHIGYEISENVFPGHQVVFGVHEDTENLHIHFAVNTTNYMTGRQLSIGKGGLHYIKEEIRRIINQFGLQVCEVCTEGNEIAS